MDTLVVTSVNPRGNVNLQRACFEAWKCLDVDILSFNCAHETKMLAERGYPDTDLIVLEEYETSNKALNKSLPLIVPILSKALEKDYQHYFLTNADIYPALSKSVSQFCAGVSDLIGFTRNDCVSLRAHTYLDTYQYRGGLDVFYFSRKGLEQVLDFLSSVSVSQHMTFGVPGWDYFMGHTLLRMGGEFLDAKNLIHQVHINGYGNIEEFSIFLPEMLKSGFYSENSVEGIAREFAGIICRECEFNKERSRYFHRAYFQPFELHRISTSKQRKIEQIVDYTSACFFEAGIEFEFDEQILGLIDAHLDQPYWEAAIQFKKQFWPGVSAIESSFLLATILITVRKFGGHTVFSSDYPGGGALHRDTLGSRLKNISDKSKRLEIVLDLFCTELVEHSVFNKELYKYLVWECRSSREIKAGTALLANIEKRITYV